jgi:DNA-binding NtrC family response regulator
MSEPLLDETLQDRRRSTPDPSAPAAPQLFLALECGAPLAGPTRHSLANIDEVLIGRGTERAVERSAEAGVRRLVLRVGDLRMSARHARLRREGAAWTFEDLESTNGSRVDGASVSSTTLEDRALLELGHSVFLFRSEVPTRPETAGDVGLDDLRGVAGAFVTLIPDLAAGFERLARIAQSSVPILLLGETGSGKERLARAIHDQSGRAGEFVAINCGAIADGNVEAQLFGRIDGGASTEGGDQIGYVRAAHGGTLFLDEVSELPQSSQAALLRVLEENEVVPVGTSRPVAVDIRVVAATHAPIDQLVSSGAFRNDLFARIAGFRFSAPPLRDRIEDLGLLIAALLREIAPAESGADTAPWKIEPAAAFALFSHDWPRNIRELKQCLASAAVLGAYRSIALAHLPQALLETHAQSRRSSSGPPASGLGQRSPQLDEQLRRELIALFTECKGNVSEVARRMGKARVQIQRWLKRFAIDPAAFRD